MIPKSEWVWYGFAGHFRGGSRCVFHMSTRIGDFLVSTVGAYYPDGLDEPPVTLGLLEDSYFETMIFPCNGEDEYGNPNVTDRLEHYMERYKESLEAEKGHRGICERVAKGKLP